MILLTIGAALAGGTTAGLETSALWSGTASESGEDYGRSVAVLPDLNGDGLADLAVGAPDYDSTSGQTSEGRAYLFLGTTSGPSSAAVFSPDADDAYVYMGWQVVGPGDVDGDGLGDLLISGIGSCLSTTGGEEGRVYLYSGSPKGVSTSAWISSPSGDTDACLGWSLAGTGDVNGDGLADFAAGAPGDDSTTTDGGAVWVWAGDPKQIDTSGDWLLQPATQAGAAYGSAVSAAGDIDGDGYGDLLVGAPGYGPTSDGGRVYLHLGSISGPEPAATWTLDGVTGEAVGTALVGPGDVNGDGWDDVLIGAPGAGSGGEGEVRLFLGGVTGLAGSADQALPGDTPDEGFGATLSSGADIDDDGLADVLIGAPGWTGTASEEGRVRAFLGTGSGLVDAGWSMSGGESSADLGAGLDLGDLDGDGFADGVVGAPGSSGDGAAEVYAGYAADWDGDGWSSEASGGDDCDDRDATINPGATESTDDGIDSDCDGLESCYTDDDGDGWRTDETTLTSNIDCDGEGTVGAGTPSGDCDDSDSSVHPGAEERCNEEDDDCDGEIDEDVVEAPSWYDDGDGDGYGDPESRTTGCDGDEGQVQDGSDCDDTAADVNPGASELCDDADNDCDDEIDEGTPSDAPTWYVDDDGDGWGRSDASLAACDAPDDTAARDGDCDDDDADIHPEAEEVCDLVDQDCDGDVDDDAIDAGSWYTDADGDGYGDTDSLVVSCDQPAGATTTGGDCDDSADRVHPGAEDDPRDGFDDDCDGGTEESWVQGGCSHAPSAPLGLLSVGLLITARRRS